MITRWSSGAPETNMGEELLTGVIDIARKHPWWHARARLAIRLLRTFDVRAGAFVLDAGCGWGTFLPALEAAGYRVAGLDVSRRALEGLDAPDRILIEADLTTPPPDSARNIYDAALALDVIEHVDDDTAVISSLAATVKPGGLVVVSVPALPELFSEFDQIQGHRRRYLPDRLRSAFDGTGLDVQRIFWWGEWMVPLVRRRRAGARPGGVGEAAVDIYRRHLWLPPWPVPALMQLAFRFEESKAIQGRTRRGTSLVAVARKPR